MISGRPASRREGDRTKLVALAATLLGFGLRVDHLDAQSLWRDEIDAVVFASRSLPELGRMYQRVGENGPAYFTVLHFWLDLTGRSDFAVRFLSVLAGVMTIALLYQLASRLFSHRIGAVAALLLAVAPYHLWYSQEAKMYALVALAATGSVFLLIRAQDGSSWRPWIAWLLVCAIGFYLHFFFALLVLAEAAAIFVAWARGRPGARRGGVLLLGLGIVYLPLAVWQIPLLRSGQATSYAFYLPDSLASILLTKFSLGLQSPTPAVLILFSFILFAGVVLDARHGQPDSLVLVVGWLVLPIALFFVVSLRIPLFLDRYLIIVLPAYVILLARGAVVLARHSLIATAVVAVALALVWVPSDVNPPLLKQDFKRAAAYLDQHVTPDDTLVLLPSWERAYLDYYHPTPYRSLDVPSVDDGGLPMATEQVTQALDDGSGTLWLVNVEPEYGDRQHRLQAWLDQNAVLLDDVPLANLELRHYARTP